MNDAIVDWLDESVAILLEMRRTADPGSEEPRNFEPDRRTVAAIAAWLLDCRKPVLLEILNDAKMLAAGEDWRAQ